MARNFSNEPDARMLALLQPIEVGALLSITVIAATTITLRLFPAFDPSLPAFWWKATANIAAIMLFSAGSLALDMRQCSRLRRWLGMALGAVVLLLCVLVLLEYAEHRAFGFDALRPHRLDAAFPGRPAPQAALAFALLGICALTWRQTKNPGSYFADFAALLFLTFNFVLLGGAFFGVLHHVGIDSGMITQPQILFVLFCFGRVVLLRRAEQGDLLAVMVNIGIGSQMVRLILPVVLLAPFALLAAEAYLVASGSMNVVYAQSVTAASAAVLLLCLVSWMGWRINGLERDLRDLSLTDELTGIFNRRGFYFLGQQAIREAQRANSGLCLFFFDLDGLKHVNDRLGHEAGSEMIKAFAGILNNTFRKSDIIARMGGDEFAVITIHDDAMWIDSIHARLGALTDAHNDNGAGAYRLSFSIGYAEFNSGHADTLENMVTRADRLMYQDKARKKLAA